MKRNVKAIKFYLIILILFLALPCYGQDKEENKETSTKGKFGSLQKSLLIPGWGQFAEKRYIEGILFLSAEIFCFYKIFSYNHKGNDYYDLYEKADNTEDAIKYRGLTEKYDTRRNKFIFAAAGVWIINLIDIYFIVKNKEIKPKNLQLKFGCNEHQELAFTVFISF